MRHRSTHLGGAVDRSLPHGTVTTWVGRDTPRASALECRGRIDVPPTPARVHGCVATYRGATGTHHVHCLGALVAQPCVAERLALVVATVQLAIAHLTRQPPHTITTRQPTTHTPTAASFLRPPSPPHARTSRQGGHSAQQRLRHRCRPHSRCLGHLVVHTCGWGRARAHRACGVVRKRNTQEVTTTPVLEPTGCSRNDRGATAAAYRIVTAGGAQLSTTTAT